jgi:hypothetical protein
LAGALLNYTPATGRLQITLGGTGVATLAFDNGSLGGSAFQADTDGTSHLLLTRI